MSTLLLKFPNDEDRESFMKAMKSIAASMADENGKNMQSKATGWEDRERIGKIITSTIASYSYDPPIRLDRDRECAVFVSGQKLIEGNFIEMRERFKQEVGIHSANVELRELKAEKWQVIQSRKRQAV
jgi:hypothetical protein